MTLRSESDLSNLCIENYEGGGKQGNCILSIFRLSDTPETEAIKAEAGINPPINQVRIDLIVIQSLPKLTKNDNPFVLI